MRMRMGVGVGVGAGAGVGVGCVHGHGLRACAACACVRIRLSRVRARGTAGAAGQVAESMLRGAETGLYHLPSPDPLLNVMISTLAGVSPRAYPFLESCLMPLLSLVEAAVSVYFDMWGRRYAARHAREAKAK